MSMYDIPISPINHHGRPVNKGWGWNWKGRERATGREREYYTRTSFGSKPDLVNFVERFLPGVEFIDGGPADKDPLIVFVMPPHSFQRGPMQVLRQLMQGDHRTRSTMRTLPRVRFSSRR